MSDQNKNKGSGWINRLKKLLNPEEPPIEIETEAEIKEIAKNEPLFPPIDEWQYTFMPLSLSDYITKKATSYYDRKNFLARSDLENLRLFQDKEQFIDHRFDKCASWSFYITLTALVLGSIGIMFGGPVIFWSTVFGLAGGSTYVFNHLAHQAHLKEMAIERQSALEECEDKMNEYAFLLTDAVKYINAQIEMWNLRHSYLLQKLGEPTDQDRQRCRELRAIHQDFDERIRRFHHFLALRQKEEILAASGVEMDRLHSRLGEHLADLKPIVPEIATDPLMLEAIKETNGVLDKKPKVESVEILIEEDIDEPTKK